MQQIHWYPGHMAKAKKQLTELMKYLDLILEVRDARLPLASHNDDLDSLLERRPTFIVLNKVDLADPVKTVAWCKWFGNKGLPVVTVNGKSGQGLTNVWAMLEAQLPVLKFKRSLRIGVVGIPNVGKSTILNRLLETGAAKTGNLPGVTRGKQWVRRNGFEILDTPGLLPPKIVSQENGLKLALIGTIREEILPAYDLVMILLERYGDRVIEVTEPIFPEEMLERYAKKRGFIIKGGAPDLNRTASTLLKEFRNGQLGRISLEDPPTVEPAG